MSRKKQQFMVIDTETTVNTQRCFNVAWQITTEKGFQTSKKDYWLPEVLREDIPFYKTDKPKTAIKATNKKVKKALEEDEEKVDLVFAYNSPFDQAAIKKTLDHEFEKPVKDLWTASALYICGKDYINWAKENGKVTEKGNIKTGAEVVYQYISGVDEFVEEHTAYQDTQVEKEILKHLLARKIDLNKLTNHPAPWRIVKARRDEMEKENEQQ